MEMRTARWNSTCAAVRGKKGTCLPLHLRNTWCSGSVWRSSVQPLEQLLPIESLKKKVQVSVEHDRFACLSLGEKVIQLFLLSRPLVCIIFKFRFVERWWDAVLYTKRSSWRRIASRSFPVTRKPSPTQLDGWRDWLVCSCVCLFAAAVMYSGQQLNYWARRGGSCCGQVKRWTIITNTHTDNTTINSFVWLLRSFEMTDYRFDIHARPSASRKWEN